MKHGTSPRTGSSGGEPGATDWIIRGNRENTTKRRPGLEHPGRSGARPKPPDWIVRGRSRCHGLERPRQRREYDKKTPRIGASGAEWSTAQAPGLDRPGGNPWATDWNNRGNGEKTAKRRPGLEHPGRTGARPKPPEWIVQGCTRSRELEHPGTQRTRTGTSGDEAAREWNVPGNKQGEGEGGGETRRGHKNKSKERMGEDKKERGREAGGEREEGEAAKRIEPGWEQPGKQRNQTGSTGSGAAQEIVK